MPATPSKAGGSSALGSNPMDQYLSALPTSASEASAASIRAIINGALAHPKVHAGFAELRAHPSVAGVLDRNGDGSDAALRTLDLFAGGTYLDYFVAPQGTYLSLSKPQMAKLRQLTVVTISQRRASESTATTNGAKKNKRGRKKNGSSSAATTVPFSLLQAELGMPLETSPLRDLEDVLISCLYSGLITGRLDQRSMSLWIEPSATHGQPPVAARDVTAVKDVPRLIAELTRFRQRSKAVLAGLDASALAALDSREVDAADLAAAQRSSDDARDRAEKKLSLQGMEAPMGGQGEERVWAAAAGGPAGMDLSMEAAVPMRRQTKRSRGGGHTGGQSFGRF